MASNGDTELKLIINNACVVGLGSFHKTLPANDYGEVQAEAFASLVAATRGGAEFKDVPAGQARTTGDGTLEEIAQFTNPQAGLAHDRLTRHPVTFSMPPAPLFQRDTTAAEMIELYWMALLRDKSLDGFEGLPDAVKAAAEIEKGFKLAVKDAADPGRLMPGVDAPGKLGSLAKITPQNLFRLGLPGEDAGPLVSQFLVRNIVFGTQSIDQRQRPYKTGLNFLTKFDEWLGAQRSGNGTDFKAYPKSNESLPAYYEPEENIRFISTMRDLARFVNKDALHQAYFNAALILLNGGARWTPGNPYGDNGLLKDREAGFGTLGGPHILALVSEVATRAIKVVWNQKWQVHLRLRPEVYGGRLHVQEIGVPGRRNYGLPKWLASKDSVLTRIREANKKAGEETCLLPVAFTAGSPTHPAYGAGHATVAGACVTVLKAYFRTLDDGGKPLPLAAEAGKCGKGSLCQKDFPYSDPVPFKAFQTGVDKSGKGTCRLIDPSGLTIEGELNKLAMNIAMGRTMGGVHWRTDNTRSLMLGEALAAHILADISVDLAESPWFAFRTFSRDKDGKPKEVRVQQGRIYVNTTLMDPSVSAL